MTEASPEKEGGARRMDTLRSPSRSVHLDRGNWRAIRKSRFPGRNAGASLEYLGRGGPRLKDGPAIFRPRFHSPRHPFPQLMLRRSIEKTNQINALNLGGKIGQPSSFGENPPIRREKARLFRPSTIKVSGEKPANAREFPSPPRAESMFAEGEVA